MIDTEHITQYIQDILPKIVELRHRFHQIPEPSFQEEKTSQLIIKTLEQANIPFQSNIAGTGIVATVPGKQPGPIIVFRADMDALNIEEASGKEYSSMHQGYAHSCGHDGHMASLLGAANVLMHFQGELKGEFRLLFQPAEESGQGALAMLEAGIFSQPMPAAIFTLHSWPGLELGKVASKAGMITSNNDLFIIKVIGKGGHGARPHESISPLVGAAKIVHKISELTRLRGSDQNRCVVSVGRITAGTQANVIPDCAVIHGTIRSFTEKDREYVLPVFQETITAICKETGIQAEVSFESYCPAVYNDPQLYSFFTSVSREFLGNEACVELPCQSTGSEDFGYYTQKISGLLIRLGVGKDASSLHTSTFDFDDQALKTGITVLSGIALRAGKI